MVLAGRWGYFKGSCKPPVAQDPDKPTNAEKEEAQRWEREDEIAQCLLGQRLPDEISMDMEAYPTVKEQWDALTLIAMPKSAHARAHMHQSFLDMRCPKGGDVREFLTSLKKRRHELKAAGVTVTEPEYERTVLNGITEPLTSYASLTMSSLRLACKLTREPFDMTDVIDTLCEEADRLKMVKDLTQGQGKGKNRSTTQAPDEALVATGSSEGSNSRRRKGNCHHCGKPGHWARECHTRKREEAAAAADQSGQAAQANPGTISKPVNKPVGSANIATIDGYESDDRGFWAVEEEAHACHAEADPRMDDSDSDDDDSDFCAEQEGNDQRLDWPDIEGESWYTEDTACAYPNHAEHPMGDLEDDSDDEWEAFRTETWSAEDVAPHMLAIVNSPEPHWAPGEEGYTPHIGDGRIRTTSSYGEQVADAMRHAHRPHNLVRSPERAHPDDPRPAIRAREGQSPGSDATTQTHRAHWLGPGTTIEEQDVLPASAALLEGEEKRLPAMSSEQTAAPGIPSTFDLPKSFVSPIEAISPQGLDSLPAQPRRTARTHTLPCIAHDTQPGEAVHLSTNAPPLAPCLQSSEVFAEDPDEAGGVTLMEDGVPAPPRDSKTRESTFAAETADAEALQPRTRAEAKHSIDKPPKEPIEKPATPKAHPFAQRLHQTGGLDVDDRKSLAALAPPLTDPAPAGASNRAITHNMPHRGAVDTSNWAAPATRPDTTFLDANGSKAVDWRATSGRASLIDNSAICWPSRQQEDVSPTISESNHVPATRGSTEAFWSRSPASVTSSSSKTLTTPFSENYPPRAFTRDRQYHPPVRAYRHAAQLNPSGLQPADDTVADAPNNTPTSAKGRHFIASLGLRAK